MKILLLTLLPVLPMFTGPSAHANEALRQRNLYVLHAIFELGLAALQQVARVGKVMDSRDS